MIVACLTIQLHLPGCTSLKEKRYVLRSLKDRFRNRFNVAVCETAYQDKWQRTEIAAATVTLDRRGADKIMDSLLDLVEKEHRAVVVEVAREYY